MNYILQINSFWKGFTGQGQLSATSIAIYFTLLHLNNQSGWKSKIQVHPREIMALTMIGTVKTVYTHLKRLQDLGLIQFQPASNQFDPTFIQVTDLTLARKSVKSLLPKQRHSKETASLHQLDDQRAQLPNKSDSYAAPKPLNKKTYKPKKQNNSVFKDLNTDFLKVYETFLESRLGLPPKIHEKELDALKNIEAYFHNSEVKNPIELWQELFDGWNRLPPFYQNQISLTQIDKNLLNFLNLIKQPYEKTESTSSANPKSERSHCERKNYQF